MTELRVVGRGESTTPPDTATIVFTANALAPSASAALDAVGITASAVVARLDELGVAERDRGAAHTGVTRRTRWVDDRRGGGTEQFVGWDAHLSVTCRVRDAEAAFSILEAVTETDGVGAHGPHWSVSADNPAHDDARQRAVAEARSKARSFAEAAGLRLGGLVALHEGADAGRPEVMTRGMALADAGGIGDVDAASQTITATVTLVYTAHEGGEEELH